MPPALELGIRMPKRPPSPRVGEGGWGDEGQQGVRTPKRPYARVGCQNAQTPPSPRVGEGGWGDEGQKVRECSTPRIACKNAPLREGCSSPSARIRRIRADPCAIPAPQGEARLRVRDAI
jgi:hypothetical protein